MRTLLLIFVLCFIVFVSIGSVFAHTTHKMHDEPKGLDWAEEKRWEHAHARTV